MERDSEFGRREYVFALQVRKMENPRTEKSQQNSLLRHSEQSEESLCAL